MIAPELGESSVLIDECLADALRTFPESFICQFHPNTWAQITLIYHKHFAETGSDISMAEILAEVIRDSIRTKRMDFLTMRLAQIKQHEKQQVENGCKTPQKPHLTVVKNDIDKDS